MKYLKTFESFEQPEGTGTETFWEIEIDGKTIRITFDDVIKHLESGIEVDPNDIKHLLIDVERDPKRVEAADLIYPIVLVRSDGEFISILDGQHRVVKAIRDGVNIKAKVLDLDLAPEEFKVVFKR
jgi:ribosomal protein L25 (general stress protein Ctc)